MEPLARVELSNDAPAEVLRLLPLVGLAPVIRADANAPSAALRVRFGGSRQGVGIPATPLAPATITIASATVSPDLQEAADLVTDSAIAAVCFILSRVLGLAAPFITADARLFDVIRAAIAVARGPACILVEGEIGVGKESLTKLIYAASRMAVGITAADIDLPGTFSLADLPGLIHAECAGLTADAVDAEIAPLLAQAASPYPARDGDGGGAVFFNRIGELTPAAQRKLLALLRSFAIDARERRPALANVRILAASTRPLAAMRAGAEMLPELHDLFDATLTIAPLRRRRRDLPLLVRHYLRTLDPSLTLNPAALRALSVYAFPGNVLELVNFLTRVAIVPPKAGSRRCAIGSPDAVIVGRAEVISQLDRGSLTTIWHSRTEWNSRAIRASGKNLARSDQPAAGEALPAHPSLASVPVPAMPASMRLTTGAVPRPRKPRGGHFRPRA